MPVIDLPGCTPEPLMSYLKALGVFRLIAEQADAAARLSWHGSQARLHSSLDRAALIDFFLERYRPTPVVGPWGARSGFYPGSSESTARQALERLASSAADRFAAYRQVVATVRAGLAHLDVKTKDDLDRGDTYIRLLQYLRNELPDDGADSAGQWLDTVYLLTADERKFPPLLGTGGNEGSGSYVSTFAQVVVALLVERTGDQGIRTALFDEMASDLDSLLVGHFNPGAIGGPNSSQGFDGGGGVNPWDYLLAIEGTLLFAGRVARRLGIAGDGRVSYPFCVEATAVGYGSASDREAGTGTRAEIWLPLWSAPAALPELVQLFGEGRAQFGRRQARNAVEFALALTMLGVSRGIAAFVRYAFVMRNGLSYFAAPLGRVPVTPRPAARLLDDPPLWHWLETVRRACRDLDKTPARYAAALRQVERALFAFANRSEPGNDAKYLLAVMAALGRAERTFATGLRFCKDKGIRPLQGLHPDWLDQADDGSAAFRLAAALAGIAATADGKVGAFRTHLEEVEVGARSSRFDWAPGSSSAVWSKQPLAANLAAVFQRRRLEAFREGFEGIPIQSPCLARLDDVLAFLDGETDDDKLADLLWGFSAVAFPSAARPVAESEDAIPFEFGVLRLLTAPACWVVHGEHWNLGEGPQANATPDPDVFHLLAARRIEQAVSRAARRLQSGGLLVTGYRNRRHAGQPIAVVSPLPPERLLAALLFPLGRRDLERIANAVLYPPESET